jgi:eukaryotic-like serine/threonine-protein kinase
VQSATRNDAKETAASYKANAALYEPAVGNYAQARASAHEASALAAGRDIRCSVGFALALSGDSKDAEQLADALNRDFPSNTLVQTYWLPTIRAQVELAHHKPNRSIDLLKAVTPYDQGSTGTMAPAYVRGNAYLQLGEVSLGLNEFQNIIDHRFLVDPSFTSPLARLGKARAKALQGDAPNARIAYQDFFALWKDADPDIPILKEAKAEYAKLQN